MSRPVPSKRTVLSWIKDFPELQFNDMELFCISCEKPLPWLRKADVMRHISSQYHKRCLNASNDTGARQRNFNLDLVEVMIGCSIPWIKLDNPLLSQFLEKCVNGRYKDIEVPTESTLRKSYLSPTCDTVKKKIFTELNQKQIWLSLSVNETTNACGTKLANVIVGGMDEKYSMRGHLIASKILDNINSKTIADLVQSSLKTLWGEKYDHSLDNFLLFITDAIPYMKDAGKILKETYHNMVHLTCLAHGLHRVAETIGECYPNIEKLISTVKKIFLKAPERVQVFQEMLPNTPLPPEPVLTRWGMWLEAASYYYCNFDAIKLVIEQLDPKESTAILHAHQMFSDPVIKENLAYIHGHFSRIHLAICDLERKPKTVDFTVVDAMNIIFDLRHYIFKLSGGVAETVKQKLEIVLKYNPGFSTLSGVVNLLNCTEVDYSMPGINVLSLKRFTYFKYAPITAVDIERAFSEYKWIFSEKRRNLTPDKLEQILIIYFYFNCS